MHAVTGFYMSWHSLLLLSLCPWAKAEASSSNANKNDPRQVISRQSDWTIGQTVQTSSGPVEGHAAPNATDVSEYLGIPYAQPPVGDLRFKPPVRYSSDDETTINGTNFGFTCMQSDGGLIGDGPFTLDLTPQGEALKSILFDTTAISEDCLTLNVWTKPQTGDAKKAVMVYIHGGSFTSGGSSTAVYDGEFLADEQDIIVVSLNYRLNIFGFPGSPQLDAQNLGLLDQRMAVEWVRDNIEAFGGDLDRITLFGQSAGGASVDFYSYAWADDEDPIVSGFIVQSGNAIEAQQKNGTAATVAWYLATAAVGCGGPLANKDRQMECMGSKPASTIANATTPSLYKPIVDDKLVWADYTDRKPIPAPLVLGLTNNEPGLFKITRPLMPDAFWTKMQSDFNCLIARRAAQSVEAGVPTWRYRYFADFPNLRLTASPPSGAYHGAELPVLFDTALDSVLGASTSAEVSFGSYLRGAWAAFAKDPEHGLEKYEGGWPLFSTNGDTLVRLAFDNETGLNAATGNMYDEDCSGVPEVTSPKGDSDDDSGAGKLTYSTLGIVVVFFIMIELL